MRNELAEMHKATARRYWENILERNREIGSLQYENQRLHEENKKLRAIAERDFIRLRELRREIERLNEEIHDG